MISERSGIISSKFKIVFKNYPSREMRTERIRRWNERKRNEEKIERNEVYSTIIKKKIFERFNEQRVTRNGCVVR